MKTEKEIYNEMKDLKDKQIWQYLLENKAEENLPTVMLDNDDTFLEFKTVRDDYIQLRDYLGWSDGIFTLLSALGIKHDGV